MQLDDSSPMISLCSQDPHVESYTAADIELRLGLVRENLVGLAILLGCDYLPRGVAGVGRELAMKFIASLKEENMLKRCASEVFISYLNLF